MNPPTLKTTLFVIGILPTLLASIIQIGYLSYRQIADQGSLIQPAISIQNSENARQPPSKPSAPEQSPYRSLILASSLIGLSGILLAGFMANYFNRRLTPPPSKMPRVGSITDVMASQANSESETAEANHVFSDQPSIIAP